MLNSFKHRRHLLVISLVALPPIVYVLACLLIAPIISHKLNQALASHLGATVKYDSLSYRFPYSVHLKNVQMFSDGSQLPVRLLQIQRLDLTLAELPRAGKPIVVKNLELASPIVHLVKTSQGLAGRGELKPPSQPAPQPQHKLSEMFELKHFRISSGKVSYEDQADPGSVTTFSGIDLDLGVTQQSRALYRYHVTANGGQQVNLNADGTLNIDQLLLSIQQFSTHTNLSVNSGNNDLPPSVQRIFHDAGITGSLQLDGKATIPLRNIADSKYSVTLTLHDGGATFGRDRFNVNRIEAAIAIDASGLEESLRVTKLQALNGVLRIRVEPFAVQTANGVLPLSNLKVTVRNDQWILNTARLTRDPADHHLLINNIDGRIIFASPRATYPGGLGAVFKQFGPVGLYTFNGSANFHHEPTTQPTVDLAIQTSGSSAVLSSYEIPATNVIGEIHLTNKAAEIKNVQADALDGKLSGHGVAVLLSPHGYQGEFTADSIDLEQLARTLIIPQSERGSLSGRGNVSIRFDGKAARDRLTTNSTFSADGHLEITGGQLWQIPVLTQIAEQSNIKGDALVASDAAAIFHIENEVVRLQHAAISSPVLGVQGSGMIGFNKSVDLDVIAAPLGDWKENLKKTNIPIVSDVAGDVAGGIEKLVGAATKKLLYEFHITGTTSNPEIHPIAAPVLTKDGALVFGKMLREMKDHDLLNAIDQK